MSYIQNIIAKYDKIKSILDKTISLINNYDSSNIDILKAYITTINELFIEIDKLIERREFTTFSSKYNLTWFSSRLLSYILTIKPNNLESFNDSIFTGLYVSNTNNINNKINIKYYNSETKTYNTDIPIRFDEKYISDLGEKRLSSALNIYDESIFYIYMNIKSLLDFAYSPDIYSNPKIKTFSNILNSFYIIYDKYLERLKKYQELDTLRNVNL